MSANHEQVNCELGFFRPSWFHLGATIVVIALSIFAFLPVSFNTLINGTVLVNFILLAVMLVSLVILVADLVIGQEDNGGVSDA